MHEHIIRYNFSFSIQLLNLPVKLSNYLFVLDFFKFIIFSLIQPFTIFKRKAIETYQVYYTALLIYKYSIYF